MSILLVNDSYLFLIVVLEGILVAFLESGKSKVNFCCPPNLSACQCNLLKWQMHDFKW